MNIAQLGYGFDLAVYEKCWATSKAWKADVRVKSCRGTTASQVLSVWERGMAVE